MILLEIYILFIMMLEGGYRPGAFEEMLIFSEIILLIGVLMMILDYVLSRKKKHNNNKKTSVRKSISTLKLTGLLVAIFGALGVFISICYSL